MKRQNSILFIILAAIALFIACDDSTSPDLDALTVEDGLRLVYGEYCELGLELSMGSLEHHWFEMQEYVPGVDPLACP